MIDEQTIFELLKLSGVPPEKARQRAIWLVEDLNWIAPKSFVPHAEHSGISETQSGKPIPLIEYSFGQTQFSVDNATNSRDKRSTSIGGTLLDRGNLRLFSIVSELARRFLPDLWLKDEDLRFYLRTPVHHLNALNEVWWLGRFVTAVDIRTRHQMHSGPEDIDWRFRLDATDFWINLEVKNRPLDVSRHAHGIEIRAEDWLSDVTKKFVASGENELNIVGLTLFGLIDRRVQKDISNWLFNHPTIDGILLWSHEGRNKSIFDRHLKAKAQLLSVGMIVEPVEERELICRNQVVLDRKFWSPEMLASLPDGL